MPSPLIRRQYEGAVTTLRACCHEFGLMASAPASSTTIGAHREIWARDAMIAALGGALVKDPQIDTALCASVRTLAASQARSGLIPNNVDTVTRRANFRAYADGGLWFVIGSLIAQPEPATIARVLAWYECQDVDQTGLLSMQESSDWQDLFCARGKGLYLNCLYVLALRKAAAELSAHGNPQLASDCAARATRAADQVNHFFWYKGDGKMFRHISHTFSSEAAQEFDSLGRKRWVPAKRLLVDERYYLPYLSFREPGEWFDMFGNLLAIIAGVAGQEQCTAIFDLIERHGVAKPPARSIHPVVSPGDPDWRDHYTTLNVPHHYHNGGIWPFLGGIYVAASIATGRNSEAEATLENLARLNEAGEFNEWHSGLNGEPCGVSRQAWSAGMFLYACECVRQQQLPHFTLA